MKISYAILTHNEGKYIEQLIPFLIENKRKEDEIVVVDDFSTEELTINILKKYKDDIKIYYREFDGDHTQKNYLNSKCSGDWIFQLDADENLTKTLIQQINQFLETAKDDGWDGIMIPRINTYSDLEDYPNFIEDNYLHFEFNERGWMHWPEYCLRIYRNLDYIRWVGEIHESIQGCKAHLQIEPSEDYAIIHEKSISKQLISDEYYNTFEHHRNLHQQTLENRKRVVEAKLESIRFNSEQGFEEEYI